MTRLQELELRFNETKIRLEGLNSEYQNKRKGQAYLDMYTRLNQKLENISREVLLLGTTGNIIKVEGIRNRIGKKIKNLRVEEKFILYLTDVSIEDIPSLIRLRYPNITEFTLTEIKPGILKTK